MSGNPDDEHVATQQLKQVSPLNGANSGGIQPQLPQAPPSGPGAGKARLQCHACNRLLEYDAGAQYVQCFSCSTMNAVQPGTQIGGKVLSMLCAICHTTNLAPYGINYVRCGSCSTISQVTHAYRQQPVQHMHGQENQQPQTQLPQPDVRVQQPGDYSQQSSFDNPSTAVTQQPASSSVNESGEAQNANNQL